MLAALKNNERITVMTVFGITGGSGSGKSLACSMLASLGVKIIDTDVIAREVVKKGSECLDELISYFGNNILLSDGELNRSKLASIAFSDNEKTEMLNKITHKYIKARMSEIIEHTCEDLIAIDGAVIIGSNIEQECEFVVSVIADRVIRIRRIKERDNLTEYQANQRIDAQPDADFYRSHSKYVIYNNGSEKELFNQVKSFYNKIRGV